ncbi:MAG: UDP-N-acetylmuramoyl-L-alanyl-D-glutamate--2,6-diaminopimelate ligase [Bacteroidales bacterium]|nr:UDP-N-acetylmuramoyl-L-alanyl-D-glutamate--2,6-diaminopimelate ligase [Bacteroidales bacterium]MCF8333289.1 UDP-N-acetylmuramoyl-L-alanyl-D-glutamate--2,6-diaminopimelate ligase [Bacteroidales bacterium]
MKRLSHILEGVSIIDRKGISEAQVREITFDSRQVRKEDVFVAIRGTSVDGHKFIPDVVAGGVKAVVCEEFPDENVDSRPTILIKVKDTRYALAVMASNYYDNPSEKLNLIGVTGTNGKTTTVTLLYHLFMSLGYPCGMLSTIENRINEETIQATHTTGDPLQINAMLAQMVSHKVTHCFTEVSSHAIDQQRIAGLSFTGGIFTNITQDHLDYHKDFRSYLYTKKAFFDHLPKNAWALVNVDDKNGRLMLQNTNAKAYTYGLKKRADFKGKIKEHHMLGLSMEIDKTEVWFGIIGTFNAYNLMATYAAARLLDENKEETLASMSRLESAEGRFDITYSTGGIKGIIDYAHTPDALENVLQTINHSRTHNETLITVIGAGGDRDKTKRPQMGQIATTLSDKVILTSDNPRNEDPQKIIDEIAAGISAENEKKVIPILNREEAIKTACFMANKGDIILVAGKGHEKYQEVEGARHHFDDKEILIKYLK